MLVDMGFIIKQRWGADTTFTIEDFFSCILVQSLVQTHEVNTAVLSSENQTDHPDTEYSANTKVYIKTACL